MSGLTVPTANVTDVCPTGMVTVAGTDTSTELELSVTASGVLVSVLRVTVAVVALTPAPSLTDGFANTSVRAPSMFVGWIATARLLVVLVSKTSPN